MSGGAERGGVRQVVDQHVGIDIIFYTIQPNGEVFVTVWGRLQGDGGFPFVVLDRNRLATVYDLQHLQTLMPQADIPDSPQIRPV